MAAVDFCFAALDVDTDTVRRLEAHLAADERARAARFRFVRDRRRFVVRRGLLREWLAGHVGAAPHELVFTAREWGKPALEGGGCHFNLGRSGEWALFAIADVPVGCDIERVDEELDWLALAEHFFPGTGSEDLLALSEPAGRHAFFRLWARLEACVKAAGLGLAHPDASAFGPPAALGRNPAWQVRDLPAPPGFAAAVAAEADGTPLTMRSAPRTAAVSLSRTGPVPMVSCGFSE